MSTVTTGQEQVALAIQKAGGRDGRRYRVEARLGDQVIHLDTFNFDSERSRQRFIRKAAQEARSYGIELNPAEYNRLLMEHAATANTSSINSPGPAAPGTEEVLAIAGIDVLGEQDDQSILIWVPSTSKRYVLKSPAKWPELEMLQALGQRGAEVLYVGNGGRIPDGMISPVQLQRAVALAASQAPRIAGEVFVGQGISKINDELLVVNGDTAFVYNGQTVRPVSQPRIGQKIIDFNGANCWAYGLERAVQAVTDESARAVLSQLQGHLYQWNWAHRADQDVAAALIPATFVQACWTWRPLVTVTGESDCGKSTLLEQFLRPVFGDWTILADRSTEAGLRQAMGTDFCPVILDEFDKYQYRAKVLELFRTASRGGRILRGTKDQTGRSYGVKHIPWFAAIEGGELWGQDRNRRIRLELNLPVNRGALVLPGPRVLHELGQQVAACALWAAPVAVRLADEIKSIVVPGVHGRLIECFSVPAAMHAVLRRGRDVTAEAAAETLRAMIEGRETLVVQGESDQVRLLNDVLAANIRVSIRSGERQASEERSVGQLLRCGLTAALATNGTTELLEAKGIMLYETRPTLSRRSQMHSVGQRHVRAVGERRLFINPDVVKRELLAGTRWTEDVQIDQLLIRLPRAERVQQRCGGGRPWGVSLPWPACLGTDERQDGQQDATSN